MSDQSLHHPLVVNDTDSSNYSSAYSHQHEGGGAFAAPGGLRSDDTEDDEQFSYFTAGDIAATVMIITNNMATLLVVVNLLLPQLGEDIVWGRLVPGVGWASLFGNLYYYWMAWRLRRSTGRMDVCAQPYGINTPGAFAFVSIMNPDFRDQIMGGATVEDAQEHAWRVGIGANLVAAFILFVGAIFGKWIAKNVPLVPLFTSLSGIAVAFLAFGSLFAEFQYPIIGLFCLSILFAEYFAGIRFYIPYTNIRIPGALAVLFLGSIIGSWDGLIYESDIRAGKSLIKAYKPYFTLFDTFKHLDYVKGSISVIVPTAITVAVGTVQCVQTAHEAGDLYSVRDSMIGDGVGTLIASITGSPLGMTVFIGHPTFKKQNARSGYVVASGVIFWFLCVFGFLAPLNTMIIPASVNTMLVAIGLDITSETIKITPHRHMPAVVIGLLPSLANWAAGAGGSDVGLIALGNGALLISMFITAMVIHLIDRQFIQVIVWACVAAFLSFFGLIHASEVGWLVKRDDISWRFTIAYLMIAALAGIALWQQRRGVIEPIREEAIEEERLKTQKEEEFENSGKVAQAPFCCGCV